MNQTNIDPRTKAALVYLRSHAIVNGCVEQTEAYVECFMDMFKTADEKGDKQVKALYLALNYTVLLMDASSEEHHEPVLDI